VPIAGFDELMLQLQEKLQLPFLLPQLQSANDKRVADYQKQFEALTIALRKPAESPAAEEARKPARKAAEAAVERLTKEKNWWAWELKAMAEADPAKREAIYREGLDDFPKSADLTACFAVFIDKEKGAEAVPLYSKAVELDPNDPLHVGNLAWALHAYSNDYDEAERLYTKALEINPSIANNLNNFALFMSDVRQNYANAERFFRRGIEIDPNDVRICRNFASFMYNVRNDYDEAEHFFRKALELDPQNAVNIGVFANFVHHARKEYDEAEDLYRKALEIEPNLTFNRVNFAQFLAAMDRLDEARALSESVWSSIEGVPNSAHAELAFTRWLLARVSGLDGTPALGRLKACFQAGFKRGRWTFDHLLTTLLPRCPEAERTLAQKLSDAILDEAKTEALEEEPVWKQVEPIPLSIPWLD
jgi:tetratricopeptide (TPR) repeat protein